METQIENIKSGDKVYWVQDGKFGAEQGFIREILSNGNILMINNYGQIGEFRFRDEFWRLVEWK